MRRIAHILQRAARRGTALREILRESQRYDLVLFGHDTHFRFGTVNQRMRPSGKCSSEGRDRW